MNDASNDETALRIQDLELKVMDLEITIDKLNETVIRLYRDSEESRDMLHRLHDKVATLTPADDTPTDPAHEIPPHY